MTEHEPGTVVNLAAAPGLHLFAQAVSTQVESSRGIKLDPHSGVSQDLTPDAPWSRR